MTGLDVIIVEQDDTRAAIRLEPQNETSRQWLITRAGVDGRQVNAWWLFGGLDLQPKIGRVLIGEMRRAGFSVEQLNGAASPSAG